MKYLDLMKISLNSSKNYIYIQQNGQLSKIWKLLLYSNQCLIVSWILFMVTTWDEAGTNAFSTNVFNINICYICVGCISYLYCGIFLKYVNLWLKILCSFFRSFVYFSHFSRAKCNFLKILEIFSWEINILFGLLVYPSISYIFLQIFWSLEIFCMIKKLY